MKNELFEVRPKLVLTKNQKIALFKQAKQSGVSVGGLLVLLWKKNQR